MAIASLEQNLAVNPFRDRVLVDKKPENVQEVKINIDEAVENAIKQYEELKPNRMLFAKTGILTPIQIQLVLSRMLRMDNDCFMKKSSHVNSSIANEYLSKLIQTSYIAGHNNFSLNTQEMGIQIDSLKGTKQNPLQATIFGNVLEYFGTGSNYCIFDIQGDVKTGCSHLSTNCRYDVLGNASDHLGNGSNSSTYNIIGDTGEHCGRNSNNCTFKISGDAGEYCGINSKNSKYYINGCIGNFLGSGSEKCVYTLEGKTIGLGGLLSTNCTFKTNSRKIYGHLAHMVFSHNTILLIDRNGKIMEEMKKK